MHKLLPFVKFSCLAALAWALFHFVYLGEWATYKNSLVETCLSRGLSVPPEDVRIVVLSGEGVLKVYSGDVLLKSYDCAIGSGPPGTGVAKHSATPLGEYKIATRASRDDIFGSGPRRLVLDYPNDDDLDTAYEAGLVSQREFEARADAIRAGLAAPELPGMGGPIAIVGNYFVFRGNRFTDGSIALANADLVELYEVVPQGTSVVIQR